MFRLIYYAHVCCTDLFWINLTFFQGYVGICYPFICKIDAFTCFTITLIELNVKPDNQRETDSQIIKY